MYRTEVWTIMQKELLTLRQSMGDSQAGRWIWLIMTFSGGALLPFIIGEYFLVHPGFLLVFPALGAVFVMHNSIDAVSGERERKTLETLLSTPVRDSAVVWGKVLSVVAIAVAIGLGNILIGIVTVNLIHGSGELSLPAPYLMTGLPVFAISLSLCTVAAAFLASMKAKSNRQATQWLTVFWSVVLIVPPVVMVLLPEHLSAPIQSWWGDQEPAVLLSTAILVCSLVATALMMLNLKGFRRTSLCT